MALNYLTDSRGWTTQNGSAVLALTGSLLVLAAIALLRGRRSRLPYPPGPPGQWFLGNLRDTQSEKPWHRYTELAKQYGDIVHLSVLGDHIIVVNSEEAANELLTKRSTMYSDRPQMAMVSLMGWDINTGLLPYGGTWRAHRRLFQQAFNPNAIQNYRPIQQEKMHDFLNKLLSDPDHFMEHNHMLIASVVLKIVYGREVTNSEDRLMQATQQASAASATGTVPGAWVVNSLPILRFLPEWFPGCRAFNRFARETREKVEIMVNEPYEYARKFAVDQPCLVTVLENSAHVQVDAVRRGVCATAYIGAAETTKSALSTFYLAMRQHTHVQSKAYEEIQRVVGSHRLPAHEDRSELPYVEAVFREVMRWMPMTPIGVPHCATSDDVYKGYFIPKGAVIVPNVWAMVNDEERYPNPRQFIPERFLTPEGKINNDDTVLTFGFGRRICVGRHFADASVWHIIATVLTTFSIEKPVDDELEQVKDAEELWAGGLVVHPKPFRCSIVPRSEEAASLVLNLDESM